MQTQEVCCSQEMCSLEGNDDLYGLGIRLGVYCSLLSTLYAKYFLPAALNGTMTTNAVFIFAILIAIIKSSASGELATIEAFVMLQILFGYVLCGAEAGSTSLWFVSLFLPDLSADDQKLVLANVGQTELAMNVVNILRTAIASFNVWFWFVGAGNLSGCRLPYFQIFFFRQFDGYGRIQSLFEIVAAIYLSFQALRHVLGIFISFRSFRKFLKFFYEDNDATGTNLKGTSDLRLVAALSWATTSGKREEFFKYMRNLMTKRYEILGIERRITIRKFMRAYRSALVLRDYLIMVWTIVVVETSLSWSHVGGVNSVDSTGQLVPLVIGLTSLIPIVNESWKNTIEKWNRATRAEGITKDTSTGHWRYRLRNNKTVQFPDVRISRRRSFELRPDDSDQFQNGSKPGQEIIGKNLLEASPTFFRTGFRNELRGPALGESGRPPSWRKYHTLKDGTIQVFEDSRPRRAVSCPDLERDIGFFQPWRFRSLWRGIEHNPAVAHVYRRKRRTSTTSSSTSSSTSSIHSTRTEESIHTSWSRSSSPHLNDFETELTRTYRRYAANRRGNRCVEDINVHLESSEWIYRIRDTEKGFNMPCEFNEILNERQLRRRWSTNLVEHNTSENDWRRGRSETRDFPFTKTAISAREHDKNLRTTPWNTRRVLYYKACTLLIMAVAMFGTPFLFPVYYAYNQLSESSRDTVLSAGLRSVYLYIPTLWQVSKILAHTSVRPSDNEIRSGIFSHGIVLVTVIPSIISLLCIGFPVFIMLELDHGIQELKRTYQLPRKARKAVSLSVYAVVILVVLFLPSIFLISLVREFVIWLKNAFKRSPWSIWRRIFFANFWRRKWRKRDVYDGDNNV